jgi:hypothetical protein
MPEFDLESCLTLFLRDEVSSLIDDYDFSLIVAFRFPFGLPCTTVRVTTHCRCTRTWKAGSGGLQN